MPIIQYQPGIQNSLLPGGSGLTISLTSPLTGATLTNAVISMLWESSPAIVMYRVTVAELVESSESIIFDTGYIVKSETGMSIQPGFIPPATADMIMRVYAATIDGDTSYDSINFSTDFAYSSSPTNLVVSSMGMCGIGQIQDPYVLPRVILDFTFPTKADVADFFDSFIVFRQEDDGEWIPIFRKNNYVSFGIAFDAKFVDMTVCSGHVYKYKVHVLVSPNVGSRMVAESAVSDEISVSFDHAFIHAVRSPLGVVTVETESQDQDPEFIRFESHEHEQSYKQEVNMLYGSGRRLPTPRFGEQRGRSVLLQGLPGARSDRRPIEALRALVDAQADTDAAWCLRLGRDEEKLFVSSGGFDYSADVKRVTPQLQVTEIFYTEDLRAFEYGLNSSLGAVNYRIVT
jgi:hypothetical protein